VQLTGLAAIAAVQDKICSALAEFAACSLWPPCIADADIIFLPCGFFFFFFFFFTYRQSEKKHVKQQYLLHMSSQYGKLWPTNG